MLKPQENRSRQMVRVNLSIKKDVWKEFASLVSGRQKSAIVTKLLEDEIERIKEAKWPEELAVSFRNMAKDEEKNIKGKHRSGIALIMRNGRNEAGRC